MRLSRSHTQHVRSKPNNLRASVNIVYSKRNIISIKQQRKIRLYSVRCYVTNLFIAQGTRPRDYFIFFYAFSSTNPLIFSFTTAPDRVVGKSHVTFFSFLFYSYKKKNYLVSLCAVTNLITDKFFAMPYGI